MQIFLFKKMKSTFVETKFKIPNIIIIIFFSMYWYFQYVYILFF